jgi:pyruvate formate lyase activating enzyme
MDATNVDLKGFTEHFYQHLTLSHLEPVLDTLRWIKHESSVWLEITNLIIPGENDNSAEIQQMCQWIHENLGDDVPLHFTAFHPDFRMMDTPATPSATLIKARDIAIETGLNYVYVGNVLDPQRESTYCPNCHKLLIERHWYDLGVYELDRNRCRFCGHTVAGHFGEKPGHWGTRRVPVDPAALLRTLEADGPRASADRSNWNV